MGLETSQFANFYISYYEGKILENPDLKDEYNTKIENIKKLDSENKITGKILDVPVYNQYDVDTGESENNLCWATCSAMELSYYRAKAKGGVSSDQTNETLAIAQKVGKSEKIKDINVSRRWYSISNYDKSIENGQAETMKTLKYDAIKDNINNGNPLGILYQDNAGASRTLKDGHWTVVVGYVEAFGMDSLIVSNDPAGGIQSLQNYKEFCTYNNGKDDLKWTYTAK